MTENQDPNPTADVQAPAVADTQGAPHAAETHPAPAPPTTEAAAAPPVAQDADPRPAPRPAETPEADSPAPAAAAALAEAEPEPARRVSVPAPAAESQQPTAAEEAQAQENFSYSLSGQGDGGRVAAAAAEPERREPERQEPGRAEPPREARDSNADPPGDGQAGAPPRIPIQRNREQGAAPAKPDKPADAPDPNKRITFGIKRNRDASAVVDEPKRWDEHFPSKQTILWQPNTRGGAKGVNGKGDGREVAVVITQEALLDVSRHVAQTLEHEVGGFLIGDHCRCPETGREFIMIDHTSSARLAEATEVSHNFTVESWAHLNAELNGKFRGKLLVGWYHSHPRMDVFLSRYDMDIQSERFGEPWMTALVLEPERHRGGFFSWRNGTVNPTEPVEFYELLERNSRESVVAWENYTGIDPVALQRPALKRRNTLTVSTPEPPPEPEPAPTQPGDGAPTAVVVAPPPPTPARRLLPWLIIGAALLLGFASVWGISRLRAGDAAENEDPAPSANTGKAADVSEVIEVPRISIVREESREYELLKVPKNALGIYVVVDNLPRDFDVKLNGRRAIIDDQMEVPGAQNRQKIFATINFATEIERMKRNPNDAFRLPIEVVDTAAPDDNKGQIAIYIDPKRLGLDNPEGEVVAGRQISEQADDVDRRGGTIRKRKTEVQPKQKPARRTPPARAGETLNPLSPAGDDSHAGGLRNSKKGGDTSRTVPEERGPAASRGVLPKCSTIYPREQRLRMRSMDLCTR